MKYIFGLIWLQENLKEQVELDGGMETMSSLSIDLSIKPVWFMPSPCHSSRWNWSEYLVINKIVLDYSCLRLIERLVDGLSRERERERERERVAWGWMGEWEWETRETIYNVWQQCLAMLPRMRSIKAARGAKQNIRQFYTAASNGIRGKCHRKWRQVTSLQWIPSGSLMIINPVNAN